ncbi:MULTISPECIES: hypothetical protein [Rhodococcus]|uniref:hypothetical protein n=1 Tax=Rhodococcus TaxID=1827 RepID=UPI0003489638|nr:MULTISPECIES: hypothetical protein [Rhodococcus]MDO2378235.1 hypothetical protein [Rhodococcus ruber]WML64743.1 hypothetical protein QNA09_08125 [Rhodococcus sp. AH-ZY2]
MDQQTLDPTGGSLAWSAVTGQAGAVVPCRLIDWSLGSLGFAVAYRQPTPVLDRTVP